jgi:hypothetical protein
LQVEDERCQIAAPPGPPRRDLLTLLNPTSAWRAARDTRLSAACAVGPEHIVGISKIAYVLATARSLYSVRPIDSGQPKETSVRVRTFAASALVAVALTGGLAVVAAAAQPTGGDATSTAPAPVTTDVEQRHDHEISLEY